MVFLLLGPDSPEKLSAFKEIKKLFLPVHLAEFNLDILDAEENLSLKDLQERLLTVPINSPKRIVLIKNAQRLGEEIDNFILEWAKKKDKNAILVLDIKEEKKKLHLIQKIQPYAKIKKCKEEIVPNNTFTLARYIKNKKIALALNVLHDLLREGERPERILGGLRYSLENRGFSAQLLKKQIEFFLTCDIEIKSGKVKPSFALEKLIVALCSFI